MSLKTVFDDLVKRYGLHVHEQVEISRRNTWDDAPFGFEQVSILVLTIAARRNMLRVYWDKSKKFYQAAMRQYDSENRVINQFTRDIGKRFRDLVTYPVRGYKTKNGLQWQYRMRHHPGKPELLPELLRGKEIIDDAVASELVRDAWQDERYEGVLADYVGEKYNANET